MAVLLALLLASGVFTAISASAAPAATVGTVDATVGIDRRIAVSVRCSDDARCRGRVTVRLAGLGVRSAAYAVRAGKVGTVQVRLSAAQYRKLEARARAGVITVTPRGGRPSDRTRVKVRAAVAAVVVTSREVTVGDDHTAAITLRCRVAATCVGTARLRVDGSASAAVPVRIAGRASGTARFALTAAQAGALGHAAAWTPARVEITERRPERVARTTALSLRLVHGGGHGHGPEPEPGHSRAYERSWKPTEYDTCTTAEHQGYAVTGVDGKLYPGWHPPVHTRADGSTCTFGHEHGDDPAGSDIYGWVLEQYRTENPGADGLPFGYGSEKLDEYTAAYGGGVHRHEDDPGHKVVVSNDQDMGVRFTDRYGDTHDLVCDHLIKAHQGSHSSDATKNNTHELIYAVSCNDGTRLLTTVMSKYGNANELHSSCTRPFAAGQPEATAVRTIGSMLPDGEAGARLIPTADCLEQYVKAGAENGTGTIDDRRGSPSSQVNSWWWAGYEQWQSFNVITDTEGRELARFEPWFGVQNPSRYYVGNGESDTVVGYLNDLAWQPGNHQAWSPWSQQRQASATPIDRRSPKAWFNGAVRDAWLTTTRVANSGGAATVVYTDPWGGNASPVRSVGTIRTYLSRTDNTDYVTQTTPSVTSRSVRAHEALTRAGASAPRALGFFYDYGRDADGRSLGVHAPN